MIRWSLIGAATVPDGGGELRLMQRGAEFSIFAGADALMNSRSTGSEERWRPWFAPGCRIGPRPMC